MKYKFLFIALPFVVLCTHCVSKDESEALVMAEKGEISISKNGDYTVKYKNVTSRFKNVDTFLWFNNEPYFALADGRIMKWDRELSNHSYNLQKIWDKLYFIKQHGAGAEWEETSINVIDQKGSIQQIKIRKNSDISLNTENYGVFYDRYIVEDTDVGFCVTGSNGKAIDCYPWPSETREKR